MKTSVNTRRKDMKKKESSNIIWFEGTGREQKRTERRYIKGIFVLNVKTLRMVCRVGCCFHHILWRHYKNFKKRVCTIHDFLHVLYTRPSRV